MIDYVLLLIVEQDDLYFLHYYETMMHDNANHLTEKNIFIFGFKDLEKINFFILKIIKSKPIKINKHLLSIRPMFIR